ncbi:hypothetical protein WMY93_026800 [Mugilogobius chulae]|uniref:Uncharacterized protein n=1 Tax=Mugilogobius chulae TaxID=88201 RepID=A0AAW0N1Z1_9GOBI
MAAVFGTPVSGQKPMAWTLLLWRLDGSTEVYVFIWVCYGFVDFDSPAAAQKAVASLKASGVQAQMAKRKWEQMKTEVKVEQCVGVCALVFVITVDLRDDYCYSRTPPLPHLRFLRQALRQTALTSVTGKLDRYIRLAQPMLSFFFSVTPCAPLFWTCLCGAGAVSSRSFYSRVKSGHTERR